MLSSLTGSSKGVTKTTQRRWFGRLTNIWYTMTATVHSGVAIPNDRRYIPSELPQSQLSLLDNNVSHGDDTTGRCIAVIAPCDMDEGYTFMVNTKDEYGDDDSIPVTVPHGGIRQGQIFYSASRSSMSKSQSFSSSSTTLKIGSISSNISEWTPLLHQQQQQASDRIGQWNDRWFDCCRLGLCHVTLWNACCCPQILAAQILSRLQLNWLGDPIKETDPRQRTIPVQTTRGTFHRAILLVSLYWCLSTLTDPNHLLGPTSLILYEGRLFNDINIMDVNRRKVDYYLWYNIIHILFGTYTLILLTKLRYQTRRVYRIPSSSPCNTLSSDGQGDTRSSISYNVNSNPSHAPEIRPTVNDCCMALFCGCCSVAQMARQTASYHKCSCNNDHDDVDDRSDTEYAVCCSINGLPQPTVV